MVIAHVNSTTGPAGWSELALAWELDPLVLLALVFTGWLYRRGCRHLAAQLSPGRGLRSWEIGAFWTGWWSLAVALVSPLHPWGQVLFAAHMTQHEILMLVAAPLLVLGRPLVAFAFALPRGDVRALSRELRAPGIQRCWNYITLPPVAWIAHGAALWMWHVPAFFEATLRNEFVHHLQHASFFGTALLFWWALFHGRGASTNLALGLLYVFTTMMHSGALGALLTLSNHPLYEAYGNSPLSWNLTPMEDQQLGGLIMWIPAGFVYVAAALALVASALRPRPTTESNVEVRAAMRGITSRTAKPSVH